MAQVQKTKSPKTHPAAPLRHVLDVPPLLSAEIIDVAALNRDAAGRLLLNDVVKSLQTSDFDTAISHVKKSLDADPKNPTLLNLLAALYISVGDADKADQALIRAAKYGGSDPKILNNQACVHVLRGAFKTAETLLRNAIRQDAVLVQCHYNLALSLFEQKKFLESQRALAVAQALEPLAETFVLQGRLLLNENEIEKAIAVFETAAQKFPRSAVIAYYLARCYEAARDATNALKWISLALTLTPDDRSCAVCYAAVMHNINFDSYNSHQLDLITRVLPMPGVNTSHLSQGWHSLLTLIPLWTQACENHRTFTVADATTLIETLRAKQKLDDPFVLNGLRYMILRREVSERLFTRIRHAYLLLAAQKPCTMTDADRSFMSALALQCHYNEYVYSESDEEIRLISDLHARLIPDQPDPTILLVLALYRPLTDSLSEAQALALRADRFFLDLVREQVINPATEREIMKSLPRLTPVQDDLSCAVEQMYLENPYPKWLQPQYRGTIDDLKLDPNPKARSQILIAGCGTGHHAIMAALMYENMQVTAIDLSRRSLAYASRKTRELGLSHIDYAQADILELGSLGQKFDAIESVGVLHHLADPEKGLSILLSLLKPGGTIRLGLYSEMARESMVAGRDDVAAQGYTPDRAGIRAFRQAVLDAPETHPARGLLKGGDFYTISTCRDLVFHIREHRYTLPQIKTLLANHDLEFLGFNIDMVTTSRFLKHFGRAADPRDLDLWNQFEAAFPSTFSNMYQFSALKRA